MGDANVDPTASTVTAPDHSGCNVVSATKQYAPGFEVETDGTTNCYSAKIQQNLAGGPSYNFRCSSATVPDNFQRLCPCSDSQPRSPPSPVAPPPAAPPPPPPVVYEAGFYWAAEGDACTTGCALYGLGCSSTYALDLMPYQNGAELMKERMAEADAIDAASGNDVRPPTRDCDENPITDSSCCIAPGWNAKPEVRACYYDNGQDVLTGTYSYECTQAPQTGMHRLCACVPFTYQVGDYTGPPS